MLKGVKDVQHGTKIDRKLADYIAMGMKEWVDKGVTHYTHWFQPLTGTTAENMMLLKHLMMVDPVEKFVAHN
jgi:glutamine synthetase